MASPLLEVNDLWRSYARGAETIDALAGVDLSLDAGEMLCIIGRSGSGKTTLLNQLGCLDTPTRGTIRICGTVVSKLPEKTLVNFRRDHIGFIFQLFHLIPTLTAVENVELPMIFARERGKRERATAALSRVGMTMIHALPGHLSAGDQQRIAIARALVRNPRILLADEPTGHLAHDERRMILALFAQLQSEGLGIILVTHDASLAEQMLRVIELEDGRLVHERLSHH